VARVVAGAHHAWSVERRPREREGCGRRTPHLGLVDVLRGGGGIRSSKEKGGAVSSALQDDGGIWSRDREE
jgi:hypothetical protein